MINACAQTGDVQKAEEWLVKMLEDGGLSAALPEAATSQRKIFKQLGGGIPWPCHLPFEAVWRGILFQRTVFCTAIDSIKFSYKSELSSRFFACLNFSMLFEYLGLYFVGRFCEFPVALGELAIALS